jgi:trehalose synthase
VIASAVGGLPAQVIDDVTGVLVSSVEETAEQIRALLGDPERMARLGEVGHQRVLQEFLITRNLRNWLVLLEETAGAQGAGATRAAPAAAKQPGARG